VCQHQLGEATAVDYFIERLIGFATPLIVLAIILIVELVIPVRILTKDQHFKRITSGVIYLAVALFLVWPITELVGQYMLKAREWLPLERFKLQVDFGDSTGLHNWLIVTSLGWVWWDFFQYWTHRLVHTKRMWFLHKHHHNVELDGFASFRHSPIELIFVQLSITLPASLFVGFIYPAIDFKLISGILTFFVLIQHSNIRIGSPLGKVFITPQMHRIHHSRKPEHWNHNFSQYFTVWDRLFGTYYEPTAIEYPETGVLPTISTTWRDFLLVRAQDDYSS
jgi:sterol desaturase/sphingolipid hydroxylase (fatty acid hydroxylase superfamily)